MPYRVPLNSQLNSTVTRPVPNRRTPRLRNPTLTQSDCNDVERHALLRVNTQNIAVNHRADLPSTAPLLGNYTHAEIISSTSHNSIPHQLLHFNYSTVNTTAKINSYSLASTFPLYRDISINSSDVGYFKLAHPTTEQVFIRLFKYA